MQTPACAKVFHGHLRCHHPRHATSLFNNTAVYKYGSAGSTLGAQWIRKFKNPDPNFQESSDQKLLIILVAADGEQHIVDGAQALANMLSDISLLPFAMIRGPCVEFSPGGNPNYTWIYMVVVPRQVRACSNQPQISTGMTVCTVLKLTLDFREV